jgi:hypothetical protein
MDGCAVDTGAGAGSVAGARDLSCPMRFKGTVWQAAKAKVVSSVAAMDRVRVIVLLHETTPTQSGVLRRFDCACWIHRQEKINLEVPVAQLVRGCFDPHLSFLIHKFL